MPVPTPTSVAALNVRPDQPDLRDRAYTPTLSRLHATFNNQPWVDDCERVKNQGKTNACTGFALSSLAECLGWYAYRNRNGSGAPPTTLSPWMLYYFARRYDEFAGEDDLGSSARAAMKAWHKHGATPEELWQAEDLNREPQDRSWVEAGFKTPLGAYYRVDHNCIPDMHAALNETGAIYATGLVHTGWDTPDAKTGAIPYQEGAPIQGGHAFLIVGYDEEGFWIQNSWGQEWGKCGFARLSYRDWRHHAMDAWVAQIGVTISPQVEGMGNGLHLSAGQVRVSSDRTVRNQQINPYVVNLGNNGKLSSQGTFRTRPEDLQALTGFYLQQALDQWKLPEDRPIKIALYAHGGLTPEDAAAETASRWIPALFAEKIFPVFLMWETGLMDTVRNILSELGGRRDAAGASLLDRFKDWKDDRLDSLVSFPGTPIWSEMKENAERASRAGGGLALLAQEVAKLPAATQKRLQFHLIGHSAGAIFHSHLLPHMLGGNLSVDGLYFMAPACTVELFEDKVLPNIGGKPGQVPCYTQFHLEDFFEGKDTCTPLYNRSLLFMVSNAFEGKPGRPILGMERFVRDMENLPPKAPRPQQWLSQNAPAGAAVWEWIAAPTRPLPHRVANRTEALTHGGFDNDPKTMEAIVSRIAAR